MKNSRYWLAQQLTREGRIVADPSELDGLIEPAPSFGRLCLRAQVLLSSLILPRRHCVSQLQPGKSWRQVAVLSELSRTPVYWASAGQRAPDRKAQSFTVNKCAVTHWPSRLFKATAESL